MPTIFEDRYTNRALSKLEEKEFDKDWISYTIKEYIFTSEDLNFDQSKPIEEIKRIKPIMSKYAINELLML